MIAEDLCSDPMDGRLAAPLRYSDVVGSHPAEVTQETIDGLSAMGLTPRDIVAITQLVSFVPYQIRVIAGLRALMQEGAASAATQEETAA